MIRRVGNSLHRNKLLIKQLLQFTITLVVGGAMIVAIAMWVVLSGLNLQNRYLEGYNPGGQHSLEAATFLEASPRVNPPWNIRGSLGDWFTGVIGFASFAMAFWILRKAFFQPVIVPVFQNFRDKVAVALGMPPGPES